MHFLSVLCTIPALIHIPAIFATTVNGHNPPRVTTTSIGHLPNDSWAENLAVRSNGQLLVTLLDVPEVYQIDPFGSHHTQLIEQIPVAGGLLGITEIQPDVFAIVAGNRSLPGL